MPDQNSIPFVLARNSGKTIRGSWLTFDATGTKINFVLGFLK